MLPNQSDSSLIFQLLQNQNEFQKQYAEDAGYMRAKLESIEAEAKKTNGRVTDLERVRWKTVGGTAAILVLVDLALRVWVK